MHRNLPREIRILSAERSHIRGMIDGIKPDALRQPRIQHWCVIGRIECAKSRSGSANALIAIHVEPNRIDSDRIAGLSPVDIERAGERIVAFGHRKSVAGLANSVAKAI